VATRTIAPNYLPVVLMTQPNPDKFHQEQNTTLESRLTFLLEKGRMTTSIRPLARPRSTPPASISLLAFHMRF
jgi:hypothetical protein